MSEWHDFEAEPMPESLEIRCETPQGAFLLECMQVWEELVESGQIQEADTVTVGLEVYLGNIQRWMAQAR